MPSRRRLDIEAIVSTAGQLHQRIEDRFTGRGISRIAEELVQVAGETEARVEALSRPRWSVRIAGGLVAVLAVALLVLSASKVRSGADLNEVNDWLVLLQAGLQDLIFIGLGAVFLHSLEGRLKRRGALAGLFELRSLAHIIDMHQLTKDPEVVLTPNFATAHSPVHMTDRFELARYLEYCSELLALTNKLGALYAQDSQDPVVLGAVRDVQDLVGMLSAKIWQKLVIIDTTSAPKHH